MKIPVKAYLLLFFLLLFYLCQQTTGFARSTRPDFSLFSADVEGGSLPEHHPAVFVTGRKPGELLVPAGALFIRKTREEFSFVLFPFIFHIKKDGKTHEQFTSVFPFYLWSVSGGRRGIVLFPLWWNFNLVDRSIFLVPPFYVEKEGGRIKRFFVAPVAFVQRGRSSSYELIPPLFFHLKGADRRIFVSPVFYWWEKGREKAAGLLPLVFWGRRGFKSYAIILPLFYHFANEAVDYSKTIFPPLYVMRSGFEWKYGVVPFVFGSKSDSSLQFTILPLLHLRKNNQEGSYLAVCPLGWVSKNSSTGGWGGGFLPFHFYRSPDLTFTMVFPVFAQKTEKSLKKKTTVLFPFLFYGRSPVERNISVLGVLWDFHSIGERRTYGFFPVFMYSKLLYKDDRFLWVAPTFQYQSHENETKFFFHPLLYAKKSKEKGYLVIFPLWWRVKDKIRLRQVGFPIFWDFKNEALSRRITVVFPLYFRYRKADEVHADFLLWYYWKSKKAGKQGWKFSFFPLFGFGKPEPDNLYWKILFGLLGYEKKGGRKSIYLFWLPIGIG